MHLRLELSSLQCSTDPLAGFTGAIPWRDRRKRDGRMGKGENGMGKMATGEGVEEDRSKGGMESEKGDVLPPTFKKVPPPMLITSSTHAVSLTHGT